MIGPGSSPETYARGDLGKKENTSAETLQTAGRGGGDRISHKDKRRRQKGWMPWFRFEGLRRLWTTTRKMERAGGEKEERGTATHTCTKNYLLAKGRLLIKRKIRTYGARGRVWESNGRVNTIENTCAKQEVASPFEPVVVIHCLAALDFGVSGYGKAKSFKDETAPLCKTFIFLS